MVVLGSSGLRFMLELSRHTKIKRGADSSCSVPLLEGSRIAQLCRNEQRRKPHGDVYESPRLAMARTKRMHIHPKGRSRCFVS